MLKTNRAILAAMLFALAAPSARAEDCHLGRMVSLDMGLDPFGRITVPMTVGGRVVPMVVDTGGLFSGLSQSTAWSLHLQMQHMRGEAKQFGGLVVDQFVEANDVAIGGLKSATMKFLVLPDFDTPIGTNGLLAPDVLSSYDVDLDFAGGKFSLFSTDHCKGKVVYWTADGHAVVDMSLDHTRHIQIPIVLDGKELDVTVDTGASYSTIGLEYAEHLFGIDEKSPLLKPVDPDNPSEGYRYPFKALVFGDGKNGQVTVFNPDIILVPKDTSQMSGSESALLGIGVLRRLHLYIAYDEEKFYITPAGAH